MANLFYGVSSTDGATQKKEVTIYNPAEEEIKQGDLLSVYFANGNTYESPTLVIKSTSSLINEDDAAPSDESVSTSSDAGEFIKSANVEGQIDYMWQSGEVCLFVLVSRQTNSDIDQQYSSSTEPVPSENDALYYMLIRGARANSEFYGLTKLFTDEFTDTEGSKYQKFSDWLADDSDDNEDKVTAATPWLLKEMCKYLIGNLNNLPDQDPDPTPTPTPDPDPDPEPSPDPEPEPEPEPTPTPTPEPEPVVRLVEYKSFVEEGENSYVIGVLTIGSDKINVVIPWSSSGQVISNTSQVLNDADIVPGELSGTYVHNRVNRGSDAITGDYFITNILGENLHFYKTNQNQDTGIYIAKAPGNNEVTNITGKVEGNLVSRPLLTRNSTTTEVNKGFVNDGGLVLYGSSITLQNNSGNGLTFNGSNITSNVPVYAPTFYEGGRSLEAKYSRKLAVRQVKIGKGTDNVNGVENYAVYENGSWVHKSASTGDSIYVKANSTTGHLYVKVKLPGYLPLGIVGYNINWSDGKSYGFKNAGGKGDGSQQVLWEVYLYSRTNGQAVIAYDTRNLMNKSNGHFILDVYILCEVL